MDAGTSAAPPADASIINFAIDAKKEFRGKMNGCPG